jgi:UDP-2,4-diacetamido-2,4,6-trideoxy-beta-L-altropyranose hydrolase
MQFGKIAFRVDVSSQIGTGHFMRCLNLASELKKREANICFISRNLPLDFSNMLQVKRIKYIPLVDNNLPDATDELEHASWLGVSQEYDAKATVAALSGKIFDWIIVDHYALDERWEKMLRQNVKKLMVIDDLADRHHDCDILIDQNYEDVSRYSKLVNKGCILLLGSKYALLNQEYIHHRNLRLQRGDLSTIKNVLVFFGGTDPHDLTGKTLEALTFDNLRDMNVDIVVGNSYPFFDKLEYSASIRGNTRIYKPRSHLADLMVNADIGIGGGGVTNWERMCMGLPSIVITLAENQVPICEILNSKGAIRLLGSYKVVSSQDISNALIKEINSGLILKRISIAKDLCDGMGLERVVNKMKSMQ